MKNVIVLTIGVILPAVIGIYFSPVFAQVASNTTVTNTNLTAIIMSKFFSVEVLYESPSTVILQGDPTYGNDVWQALDFLKQYGYKIDAVAQVTESESSAIGNTRYLTPIYTMFLSK